MSSTQWSERIGFVASLATLQEYEKNHIHVHITELGQFLSSQLKEIFSRHQLNIDIGGIESVPMFHIHEENPFLIKTLWTQLLLKKGILASSMIYLSYAHTREVIDSFLDAANEVCHQIQHAKSLGTLESLLEGHMCHQGFERLT